MGLFFKGFIYQMRVDNWHTKTGSPMYDTSNLCPAPNGSQCAVDQDFENNASGTACDQNDCVDNGKSCSRTDCPTCEDDFKFCNLCKSKFCKECSNYTDCTTCTDNATKSNADCTCNDGYFEDGTKCTQCGLGCKTCPSQLSNWANCEDCLTGKFKVQIAASKYACLDYCPTGYQTDGLATPVEQTCDWNGVDTDVEAACFNFNTFDDSSWSIQNSGKSINVTATQNGTVPAYNRGQYFDGSDTIDITNLRIGFNFSLFTWIRLDADVSMTCPLFSKEETTGSNVLLSIYVQDRKDIVIEWKKDATTTAGTPETFADAVTVAQWTYLRVMLNN